MAAPDSILFVRLSSIGDVLFTLPIVNAIRSRFPQSRLTFLVKKKFAFILEGFEGLHEVIEIDREHYRPGNLNGLWTGTFGLVSRLRRSHFDLTVDLHGLWETGMLSRLTGAPERWGCANRPNSRWAYTRHVRPQAGDHPVDVGLRLLRLGGIEPAREGNLYRLPERYLKAAQAWLRDAGLASDRPTIFIQPFTSMVSKNWPLEKFVAFASHWKERGLQVIFGGSPADRDRLASVLGGRFALSAGAGFFVEAGIMKLSSLAVGCDTGLTHLATALGARVMMIRDDLCPVNTYPYGHPEWAVMPARGRRVAELEVEPVVAMSRRMLGDLAGRDRGDRGIP